MGKRVISMLLILCMILPVTVQNIGYVRAAENPPASVSVEYEGAEITDIVVPQNEKRTVIAVCTPDGEGHAYQWQVLIDLQSDLWADITGAEEQSLELSYALLSSVLDASGSGYIRCAADIDGETVYSKSVCATISFTPEVVFEPGEVTPVRRPGYAPREEDEPEQEKEYVFITVNYIDAVSGKTLFGSHTSKIETGTTFSEIVHSPTFLGFAPYYYTDKWDKDKDSINSAIDNPDVNADAANAGTINFGELLDNNAVDTDITVNVYYWAIDVSYAVKYFFQNINDDYYTEQTNLYYVAQAKTGTIISDAELQSHAGNPTGFSALYHYPESVAADGSTVFECYYDRNYYFMKFDMVGGYGVDPIYARYDTPIVVNDPTRPGYTFQGWDELERQPDGTYSGGDGQPDSIPERISTENKYYKALWKKADTTYTVIYWLQNANDEGYSYLGYNTYPAKAEEKENVNTNLSDAIGVKDDPARLATLRFFELNTDKSDKTVTINGDGSTVANVYYDRKEYTLKFYYAREYTDKGTKHYQICGNTSAFSDEDRDGNGTTDIATLFGYVNGNWSDVTAVPTLKNDNAHYQTGTENIHHNNTDYTYYYFTVTDKYGCDLTDEWPIGVLETANLTQNINGTKKAYFSAWNPEHHLYYGQHAMQEFNGNRTVKGLFQKLDRRILYDSRFGADSNNGEVRFLAFWTNALSNQTWTKSRRWVYNIYLQDVDGKMPDSPSQTIITYDTNEAPNEQTVPSIVGFTHSDTTSRLNIDTFDGNCKIHEMNFYYTRTQYDVQFYNNGELIQDYQYERPFEFPIGTTLQGLVENGTAIPSYPKNLEPNAYYFEGWYTTADCADGSGFIRRHTPDGEWKTGRAYYNEMDANKLILYAHWAPLQHEVRFFQTYDNLLNYGKSGDDSYIYTTATNGTEHEKVFSVAHGNVVGTIDFPTYEENGTPMEFKGWFYMKDGVKTMYTPADMPVKQDLYVFAEWGSKIPQPYRIQYMKYGTKEKIADDTVGYAYQGSTRTFLPKAGEPFNQLYDGYNKGWYPTLASHSITIKAEADKENPRENIYTFYYVEVTNLPYTVKYVDKQTGQELGREIHQTNSNAVVTERFKPFEGYVPDAFYKRLVLSIKWDENDQISQNPEDNVITFYYTKNDTTAFYAIHYMLQKPGTTGENSADYVESDIHTEGTGNINETIIITPIQQTGYTVKETAIIVHGNDETDADTEHANLNDGKFQFKLDKRGTELWVYYALKTYDYTVKYLEQGTEQQVHDPKTVSGKEYGTVVTETAAEVSGYTALAPTEKTLTIRAYENESDKDDPNVIIFYYIPKTYAAEYKVAGGIGGTLDNYGGKAVANADGEYNFKGSAPTADEGFEFAGWYTDADCTKPVDASWVNTADNSNRLIPKVEGMKPEPDVNIYYAKFKELKGALTIKRSNAQDEGNGTQVFVYKVTYKSDPSRTFCISITGNGSKTIHGLRCGTYTVEQMNDWSWRYSDKAQEVTLVSEGTEVEFNQSAGQKKWLNGNSSVTVNKKKTE